MKKDYTPEELLHKAAAYCSPAEHCISEVTGKLETWGATSTDIQKIIQRLIDEGFINEERFARAFVTDKFRFNKWGKIKIALALRYKGISQGLIQQSLDNINEEEYKESLILLLQAKRKSIKSNDEYERNGKLIRFAQSRGFEYNIIEQCLKGL